ncbi:MAG: hypothetical protein IJN67_07005 [Oscillospiraceae bacterium]|nr:hypothetical protein [Oscillospiraceae bacterium]
MPKIIVTSTFRKGGGAGKKGGAGGLLKYMGTREGVEKLPLSQANLPATKRQKSLIESVIKRIPNAVEYPEYQEFLDAGTKGAANDFLNGVIKQNEDAEKIGKLVSYMAERPGVVKLGKHGLFSQTDEPIDLDKAAEEVANHEGYIWTHIVSLHREDAERLGYNNAESWKSLVRRNVTTIAEAHKIPVSDLQWYAAFHDTGHHPHIHLMVYSKGQEGYLSKQSIDILRSCFGNDIFQQEQYHLFQLQTGLREDIKEKSEQKIRDLISRADAESAPTEQLQFLFVKLRKQLDQHKGKKVYGYLPKQIKATVNEIVAQLSTEPTIEELYKEWNKVNREKLSLYYENKDPTVPLVDNKEFRSIKNMIIRAVMEMPPEVEIAQSAVSEKDNDDEPIQIRLRLYPEEVATLIPRSAEPLPIVIRHEKPVPRGTMAVTKGIIGALARLIGNKCMDHQRALQSQIDHRLKQQMNEKKLAMGLKIENTQKASYQTEEEYEQSM